MGRLIFAPCAADRRPSVPCSPWARSSEHGTCVGGLLVARSARQAMEMWSTSIALEGFVLMRGLATVPRSFRFVIVVVVGLAAVKGRIASSTEEAPKASVGRAAQHSETSLMLCGRYSLFMLFRLLGHDIPYAEIERHLAVGPKGSSLREMRDAAKRLGVKLSIYKCDPSRVDLVRHTPSIALIEGTYVEDRGQSGPPPGHYVVTEPAVVDGEGWIHTIDGSYGYRQSLSDVDFASIWTGYYITGTPWHAVTWRPWAASALAMCWLGVVIWRFRSRYGHPVSRRWSVTGLQTTLRKQGTDVTCRSITVVVAVALWTTSTSVDGVSAGELSDVKDDSRLNRYDHRDSSWQAWREPRRDAVNVLYLLLRHCGMTCSYQTVSKALGDDVEKHSFLEIRNAATTFGLKTRVYRCSPTFLASLEVPVVIHMEGNVQTDGRFGVLWPGPNESEQDVVSGSTLQLATYTTDKLLRNWDGLILYPERQVARKEYALAVCLFVALAGVRCWKAGALSFGSAEVYKAEVSRSC